MEQKTHAEILKDLKAVRERSFMKVTCPYCLSFYERADTKGSQENAAAGEAKSKVIAHIRAAHKDEVTIEN